MLWLNASHNEVPAMSGRVFSRNGLLRVLNLSHNKLTSLDAQSLRGMRFMRRLYFSDNLITRVGRGTFRSVTRYEADNDPDTVLKTFWSNSLLIPMGNYDPSL